MDQGSRIVALIDMDCFYCQVEEKLNPELKGKPVAVVQYNPWKGGGIMSVNYIARAMGVERYTRGDDARKKCPEVQLPAVPCVRGKSDLSKYRDASKDVAKVLQRFTPLFERASIDEAYLDITNPVQQRLKTMNVNTVTKDMLPNTFALGYDSIGGFVSDVQNYGNGNIDFDYEHSKQLLVGAVIVSEIRAAVFKETGYECSAGIAHNKIMAKLVCGMNKPNKQTVLPKHCVDVLFQSLPVKKVKHLGRKFGDSVCETLNISTMYEMQKFTEKELQAKFGEKDGSWLYNIARGIDSEPVQVKLNPKSIGCCKQFRGKNALADLDSLKMWLRNLSDEIEERLEHDSLESNRTPRQMVVSFSTQQSKERVISSSSRSYNFTAEDELCGETFEKKSMEMVLDSLEGVKLQEEEPNRQLKVPITLLGISVGKFEDQKTKKIQDYFSSASTSKDTQSDNVPNKTKKVNINDKQTYIKSKIKNEGKSVILQKFFQPNSETSNSQSSNVKVESKQNDQNTLKPTLDIQESFFINFLKSQSNNTSNTMVRKNKELENSLTADNCGESSNDTDYSGTTVEMEINKSLIFMEEDAGKDHINFKPSYKSKFRELSDQTEQSNQCFNVENTRIQAKNLETFQCLDCGKAVSIDMFDTHADYHLALKLREEERDFIRKEVLDKNKEKDCHVQELNLLKTDKQDASKKDGIPSIGRYFMKIDGATPMEMCSECSKKVPLAKFAEHLDFHEAQKLSRELNHKSMQNNFSVTRVNRKRKSTSPIKKPRMPSKSIDLFFR